MRFQPCLNEEQQDFIALHEEIDARFVHYAEKFLGRDDAEDAVADVMSNLWERWATLTPAQRNDRYAFGILRHGIRSSLRTPDRFVGLDEAECELELQSVRAHDEAIREIERAERDAIVAEVRERAVEEMPVRRREVLLLVLEHDLSYREAGEALGLNKGTIAQHMRLAFLTLRWACVRAELEGADAMTWMTSSASSPVSKDACPPTAPRLAASGIRGGGRNSCYRLAA